MLWVTSPTTTVCLKRERVQAPATIAGPDQQLCRRPVRRPPTYAELASAVLRVATVAGAGGLFLEVGDRNAPQRILDDFADHAQLTVTRNRLQIAPVLSVYAVPRYSFARPDHIEHGNLVRVTYQCVPTPDSVMRE